MGQIQIAASTFRRLEPDSSAVIQIREWSRMHDELQAEEVQLTNRLREQLRRYYPQFLAAAPAPAKLWALDLWHLVPTPAAAAQVEQRAVKDLLLRHRIRKADAQTVLATLRQQAMTVSSGTVAAATGHIELLSQRLRLVLEHSKACERKLQELLEALSGEDSLGKSGEQCVVTIAQSMPGIGTIVAAALLAEAGKPLVAGDYRALRTLSGVAPVTKRSGRSKRVVRRYACNWRLSNALFHWGRAAARWDPLWKSRYQALRARGCSEGRALRSLGDSLLRVLCAMIRADALYDADRRRVA